ncbi:MAG: proton-conducting transporter membrane subunit, partial [Ectothiorhodospiraceae bacterium]|nr:proton-conducting transporter membrane subunit [Ectothiorhodospiraceae bacterium]
MSHWIILPILLPLAAAVLLLAGTPLGLSFKRRVGLAATVLMLPVALKLLAIASGGDVQVYALGDWPAPVGIVLMLDRLSAMMLVLTSVLALASLLYAVSGSDALGRNFHALFQLQLMGINGAFLTGDIFNLFVFFEILLLASYGLLMHGGGAPRARAGLAYVVLNLVGSSVFLVGLGLLYGTLGTLNMADMALQVRLAPADDIPLIRTAATLLLVVFGLKAAMLPLFFWLPRAYGAASAPVAALFAIMTKVGIYAIVRTYNLGFSPEAEALAGITEPWLLPLA